MSDSGKSTRGILNPGAIGEKFDLARIVPSEGLGKYIEHFWVVNWNLSDQEAYRTETIPFPAVHIAIEQGHSEIHGVVTKKFCRVLTGQGRVVGVRFRPAMFHPFFRRKVVLLTDRILGIQSLFGQEGLVLKRAVLSENENSACIQLLEDFLSSRLGETDGMAVLLRDTIEQLAADRSIVRVEQIAKSLRVNVRSLQTYFNRYVGVSPKWVIKRYRLQEAAEAIAKGVHDFSGLASEMGYFDQSHFIKDFKALIGKSPIAYQKSLSGHS
jgi:AraC-like DNA-binding protein